MSASRIFRAMSQRYSTCHTLRRITCSVLYRPLWSSTQAWIYSVLGWVLSYFVKPVAALYQHTLFHETLTCRTPLQVPTPFYGTEQSNSARGQNALGNQIWKSVKAFTGTLCYVAPHYVIFSICRSSVQIFLSASSFVVNIRISCSSFSCSLN
jgi:hypothetical protein